MDDRRPDPDTLIADAAAETRGRFKIFLGAAPGVGKTWEMLTAARLRQAEGADVVVGVVETHGRAGTEAQVDGLPILPRKSIDYRGQVLEEFDLDAALRRRPGLILIDELAHTNATRQPPRQALGGCGNPARLQGRCVGDAERAAFGKPERHGGPHHRGAGGGNAAGPGAGDGQRDRADRPAAGRAANPAARRPHLPAGCGEARARWVFSHRQPDGAAGDRAAPGGGARR